MALRWVGAALKASVPRSLLGYRPFFVVGCPVGRVRAVPRLLPPHQQDLSFKLVALLNTHQGRPANRGIDGRSGRDQRVLLTRRRLPPTQRP